MTNYDGRISESCKTECQQGECAWPKTHSGCGGCCGCLGPCVLGWQEQEWEEFSKGCTCEAAPLGRSGSLGHEAHCETQVSEGYVKVERCTCNAVFCGPGSGHESDCGWVET